MRSTNSLYPLQKAVVAALGMISLPGMAVVVWDEGVQGDLSNDRLAPTALSFASGNNEILATSVSGDREYLTFTIPAGFELSSVTLNSYAGIDGTAFFGIQVGTTLTEPPTATDPANLLGYTHFGPDLGNVGSDILPAVGLGPFSQGFTPPLPANSYTVWLQQAGANASSYQFTFSVAAVPEPEAIVPFVAGGLLLGGLGLRRFRNGRA